MEYRQATDALSYAKSLSNGDAAISSLIFDESVINVEGASFASNYAKLKTELTTSLETLISDMDTALASMNSIETAVKGYFKVPIGYERKYSEGGGRLAE